MRIFIMSIVAFISYLLQSTLLEYIEVYGVKPNIMIIIIISYALIRGREEGAIYGLFSGLLVDVMAGKMIGIYALLGLYLGLMAGALNKNLNNENYLNTIVITAVGTFLYDLLLCFFTFSVQINNNFLPIIVSIILPEVLYNALLSIFIYFIIIYINKKLDYRNRGARMF